MGSDMYLNPPTAADCRRWSGHGVAVNLKEGIVIKKHKSDKPFPNTDFKWIDEIPVSELANALKYFAGEAFKLGLMDGYNPKK